MDKSYKNPSDWAYIARSECQTMIDYIQILRHVVEENVSSEGYTYEEFTDKLEKCKHNTDLLEIISDEVNHCLIALFNMCKQLKIRIPTDNFPDDLPFKC